MSNYDDFLAEIKRAVTEVASKVKELDWQEATDDLMKRQIYLEELDNYKGTDEIDSGDFYSSSNKTFDDTKLEIINLNHKINFKWKLNFDFIKVLSVETLEDVNAWEVEYTLIIKKYDINLLATIKSGIVKIQQYPSSTKKYDDNDFGVYSNLEHYKLLAILKQ